MATVLATTDAHAKVSVKTQHGALNLPAFQAHAQHIPTIEVVKQFSATTQGQWSSYSDFTLTGDQLPDLVDTITLQLSLAAGSKTGGSYVGLAADSNFLYRLVEVYIGNVLVSSLYPEHGYLESLLHYTDETKFKLMPIAGNATQTNRRSAGTAAQTLFLNLPVPWILKKTGWLARQSAAPIRLKIYHADLASVISTDGTSPSMAINSLSINVTGRMYTSQASVGALINNQKKLGSVSQRFWDPVQQQIVLASGSTAYTLQLTNLVGLFSHVWFVIRAQSSVGTPLGNTPDAFTTCVSYNLKDSAGNLLQPETLSAYSQGTLLGRYVTGNLTDIAGGLGASGTPKVVYPLVFTSDVEKSVFEGTSHGYLRLDGLAKLTITFASSLSAAYVVDVIGYVAAQLTADSTGAISKVLVSA